MKENESQECVCHGQTVNQNVMNKKKQILNYLHWTLAVAELVSLCFQGHVFYTSRNGCGPLPPPPKQPEDNTTNRWIVILRRHDCDFDVKVGSFGLYFRKGCVFYSVWLSRWNVRRKSHSPVVSHPRFPVFFDQTCWERLHHYLVGTSANCSCSRFPSLCISSAKPFPVPSSVGNLLMWCLWKGKIRSSSQIFVQSVFPGQRGTHSPESQVETTDFPNTFSDFTSSLAINETAKVGFSSKFWFEERRIITNMKNIIFLFVCAFVSWIECIYLYFFIQVLNAQNASYVAAVIHNVGSDELVSMGGSGPCKYCTQPGPAQDWWNQNALEQASLWNVYKVTLLSQCPFSFSVADKVNIPSAFIGYNDAMYIKEHYDRKRQ